MGTAQGLDAGVDARRSSRGCCNREVSLADVPEITHPIQRRSLRPLGPANLTAHGDGVNPTYATGQDVTLDWTLTSEDRAGTSADVDVDCRRTKRSWNSGPAAS